MTTMIIAQNSGKKTDANPENFGVIDFSGCDVVSCPHWFDINIRMARTAKTSNAAPPDVGVFEKSPRDGHVGALVRAGRPQNPRFSRKMAKISLICASKTTVRGGRRRGYG